MPAWLDRQAEATPAGLQGQAGYVVDDHGVVPSDYGRARSDNCPMLTLTTASGCETTGQVFPDAIQNRDWVGYHGTASAYSARIESEGFVRSNGPISDSDIEFVVDLADRHNADPTGKVSGFKALNSVSFSSSPLVALSYAAPGHCGGQGVNFVHEISAVLIGQHAGSLTCGELTRLKSIVDGIDLVRQSQPAIYAVDLQGITPMTFQTGTAAIHIYEDVPSGRILAKALVSADIDRAAIDGRMLRNGIRNAYLRGSGHWICQVPRP